MRTGRLDIKAGPGPGTANTTTSGPETDEDFQATAELVRKARYKNCFVFKYSPRPGTTVPLRL